MMKSVNCPSVRGYEKFASQQELNSHSLQVTCGEEPAPTCWDQWKVMCTGQRLRSETVF